MAVQEKHNEHHYIHNYNVSFFSYSTTCFKHVSITSGIFKIIDLKTAIVIPVYRSTDTTNMFF